MTLHSNEYLAIPKTSGIYILRLDSTDSKVISVTGEPSAIGFTESNLLVVACSKDNEHYVEVYSILDGNMVYKTNSESSVINILQLGDIICVNSYGEISFLHESSFLVEKRPKIIIDEAEEEEEEDDLELDDLVIDENESELDGDDIASEARSMDDEDFNNYEKDFEIGAVNAPIVAPLRRLVQPIVTGSTPVTNKRQLLCKYSSISIIQATMNWGIFY
jgi:hypothetical protein